MGALAVDMGMLMKQREDAQRAADAAALAGASAFQNAKPLDAIGDAKRLAFDYLARNYVGGTYIDTTNKVSTVIGGNRYITTASEGTVVVLPDSVKVRVIVRRPAVGTLFARVLGYLNVPIAAKAAAEVSNSGASKCVMPFAMPDLWHENVQDNSTSPPNRIEDQGNGKKPLENWIYSVPEGDSYRAFQDPNGAGEFTGLGSSYRNGFQSVDDPYLRWDDYGRRIDLKDGSQNNPSASTFGLFLPLDYNGGDITDLIVNCGIKDLQLGVPYPKDEQPGSHTGPVKAGITTRIQNDADACWAEFPDPNHSGYTRGEVRKRSAAGSCSEPYPGWESSPRVVTAPLFEPSQVNNGRSDLTFNNMGVYFLESYDNASKSVWARFLFFAKGTGEGPTSGSLVKKLHLVE
jgi:Flp pilus assembly protein TadG